MKSKRTLLLFVATLVVILLSILPNRMTTSGPLSALLIILIPAVQAMLSNVVAAPWGNLFDAFVRNMPPSHQTASLVPSAEDRQQTISSSKGVVFRLAALNVITLLMLNKIWTAAVLYFQNLESAGQAKFSDTGFVQMQVFLMGLLILVMWLPAFTAANFRIGCTVQKPRFREMLLSIATSFICYFLLAKIFGLETGLGNPQQTTPPIVGINPVLFAYASQIIWSVAVCLAMSVYAFAVERLTRVFKKRFAF